jgi:hypothetical protein
VLAFQPGVRLKIGGGEGGGRDETGTESEREGRVNGTNLQCVPAVCGVFSPYSGNVDKP